MYSDFSHDRKLRALVERYSFRKLTQLELDDTGRISRRFVKRKEVTDVLYAIVVDGDVKYIGKTNCLWKRFDTYRNAKYWKNAFDSNKAKTQLLEDCVSKGTVDIYVRDCVSINILTDVGNVHLTTMHSEETRFIKLFSPEWNVQHAKHA